MFISATNAQAYKISSVTMSSPKKSEQTKGVSLGYCNNNLALNVGMDKEMQSAAAIRIPAEMLTPYKGNQIIAVRFGQTSNAKDVTVFIKKELNKENIAEIKVGDVAAGWNETSINYTIDDGDLYIGYESTGTNQIALSDIYSENGLFLRENNSSWINYATAQNWNSLCLRIIINGNNMPESNMAIIDINDIYAQQDKEFAITGSVENLSTTIAGNYEISYQINDNPIEKRTINDIQLKTNQKDTFEIILPALDQAGEYKFRLGISQVNGNENSNISNKAWESTLHCKEFLFPRKVVVEEGSGTWCQYCVRGIVGMKKMRERYPDSFIGIVSHSNDIMATSSYSQLHSKYFSAGLPNSIMNRKNDLIMDPSFENLEKAYKQECIPSDIGITVEANFSSVEKESIDIATTTTFGFSKENVAYRIVFVLIEDNVQGTGSSYEQKNAYAKESGTPLAGIPMDGFEDLPYVVPAEKMIYENVARGIYKSFMGTLNSVPYSVEKGKGYKYSYSIDKNSLKSAKVNKKENLEVVAILLDTNTGEVINADKVKVKEYNANSICKPVTATRNIYVENGVIHVDGLYDMLHVFTLDGINVSNSNLQEGIYLVQVIRGNETAIQKVIVK